MAALDHITIEGFRSIASIKELALRPINVIVGANGAGKSNFIGAFALLNAIREGQLQEYVKRAGGADRLLHFGTETTTWLNLRLSFDGGKNEYEIGLIPTEQDELFVSREVPYFWDKGKYDRPYADPLTSGGREAGLALDSSAGIARRVRKHLESWRIYHFHDTGGASPMKKTVAVNDNRRLRPDASNLAAFLYRLQERHETEYDLIRRTVRRVAPFFDDFVLEPLALNPDHIRLEWRHTTSDQHFDVSAMSDGTLRFIALATLLLQPVELRPSVILIDEPELGLHPYAIGLLASMIRQASVETQVIASTQSPILLDHFEPEDVLVADRVKGGTTLRRLEREPLDAWLEEYSLGQLWEKNELGGRPKAEG